MPITDHEALDAALDDYLEKSHEVLSVIGLKAPGVDFSEEVAKINAAKAELDAKLAELRGDVPAVEAGDAAEVPATDAAVALADEHGVDLSMVEATGASGQVVVGDVRDAVAEAEAAGEPVNTGEAPAS